MRSLAWIAAVAACSKQPPAAAVDAQTAQDGAATSCAADQAWAPLTITTVIDPLDHGANGDGAADDLAALSATITALPASGGIVWIAPGKTFRKTGMLRITRAHVKLWSVDRAGGIIGFTGNQHDKQALLCQADGCGFFGLLLSSDASMRLDTAGDNQITIDHVADAEIVGNEITNSTATGVFLYGSQRSYVEGNYIHDTWADHIHHTDGARQSWCWDNWIFNEPPSLGDDGIACVTYGVNSPKCGDMEWWNNTILAGAWGRGYSAIGGENIVIHHNWAIHTAGAGIIVASEGSYQSASSQDITAHDNWLYQCSTNTGKGHSGILVSGGNSSAPPLARLTFTNNVVAETETNQAYRAEGLYDMASVMNTAMSDHTSDLPAPMPTRADVKLRDTAILATRDTSWVATSQRAGLYRIHVRRGATGFEQRFEYIFRGSADDVDAFTATGPCTVETRVVDGKTYALVLSPQPLAIPATLEPVTFIDLRTGDNTGALTWLWKRVNERDYL